jgi:hypothetical protein
MSSIIFVDSFFDDNNYTMVSISILLFLGAVLVTIFIGRLFECILRKFRNRDRKEIFASDQQYSEK